MYLKDCPSEKVRGCAIDIRISPDKVAIQMLGDGAPNFGGGSGPGSVDPTQPLLLLVRRLQEATSATFDDPEQFIEEIVQELLELPPERRFEDGVEILDEQFTEEFGSIDAFEAQFPLASAFLFAFLEQLLNQWSKEIAESALEAGPQERNALLLVLGAVDVMHDAMNRLQAGMQSDDDAGDNGSPSLDLTDQDKNRLGSVCIAIYARLYREIKRDQDGEQPSFDALAKDVLYGERVLTEVLHPAVEYPSIDEMTDEEIVTVAIRRGALRAYVQSDISIGRGAELAGMTQEQFVELLEQNGIRPDYGPDSVEELYSGPDLMNE
jgi:predicted HTH domain antitoxin